MVAAPIVNHQIQETNEIINGKFSYLLDQQGNQGVGVKISKFMPAALQDVLDTPQKKYIWDTFVELNEERNEMAYKWPKLRAVFNAYRTQKRISQNKYVPMQYRVPYMHQHSFVSMSFPNVAQDNNAALDEITHAIENDLFRDLMLGIRTFPKEVPQECYAIRDGQFKVATTPSFSNQSAQQIFMLTHVDDKKTADGRVLVPSQSDCTWKGTGSNESSLSAIAQDYELDYDSEQEDDAIEFNSISPDLGIHQSPTMTSTRTIRIRRAQVISFNSSSPYFKHVIHNTIWLLKWILNRSGDFSATFYFIWEIHSQCDCAQKNVAFKCMMENVTSEEVKQFFFKCNNLILITVDKWIPSIVKGQGLQLDEYSGIICRCELIQKYIISRIFNLEGIHRSFSFWMYPYVLLKSVIISKALRVNVGIPIHLQMPPMVLRNCIRKQSADDIILVFMGEDKMCATYWLSGIIRLFKS